MRRATLMMLFVLGFGACDQCGRSRRQTRRARRPAQAAPLALRGAGTLETAQILNRLARSLSISRPPLKLQVKRAEQAAAVAQLQRGALDLALFTGIPTRATRDWLARDAKKLRVMVLGADSFALLTNVTNRSHRLDLEGLRRILLGQTDNWREVQGENLPLVPFTLQNTDGLLWLRRFLQTDQPFGPSVRQVDDVGTLLESVRRTPGGLGLLPVTSWPVPGSLPAGTKLLSLAPSATLPGYLATDQTALAKGHYLLRLPMVLVIRRPGAGAHQGGRLALDRMLRGHTGKQLGGQLGLPPLPELERSKIERVWLLRSGAKSR
jgi:phosphate transport system substrate-binding protein